MKTRIDMLRTLTFSLVGVLFVAFALGAVIASQSSVGLPLRLAEMVAGLLLLVAAVTWFLRSRVIRPLGGMVRALAESSTQIQSATAQVTRDGDLLATATSSQAASIEEMSATVEELASMTRRSSRASTESPSRRTSSP